MAAPMISIEEARQRIVASLAPTGPETVPVAEGAGRVLARPVEARRTQPPAAMSAMDGFALRAADATEGARLKIIGAAPAGHPFDGSIGAGEAVRIFTGSVIPDGADTVLIQEDAEYDDSALTVREAARHGRHIRVAGLDFRTGDAVLTPPRRLGARDIGLAAAADHPWLTVHRRPVVAVLATGDEIALPGEATQAGGIVSSNSHALAAFIRAKGGVPIILPIAGDDTTAIADAADAASRADLLVTTGGASVGAHDLVQAGLGQRGLTVDFWKIAMRPGKPLMFGQMGALPVLGLPGNPVSALVCALLFLGPALDRLSGLPGDAPVYEPGRSTTALKQNDRRADHLRARMVRGADGVWEATVFDLQDSSMLSLLAQADGLVFREPHAPQVAEGGAIQVLPLSTSGL